MRIRKLLVISLLAFTSFASACTTQAVRCDGKLSPINAPAAVSKTSESASRGATP